MKRVRTVILIYRKMCNAIDRTYYLIKYSNHRRREHLGFKQAYSVYMPFRRIPSS